jgi:O-antigen/teichoic acid export membrane protein
MAAGGVLLLLAVNLETIYKFIPQAYGGTTVLVLLIGSSKFCDALLGNNNAILFNSPYYKSILRFGLFLAFMTVVLNYLFIPKFGIMGAAIASFLAITFYDTAKVIYVNVKYNMHPFSKGTAYLLIIITISFTLAQWIPNLENRYMSIGVNTLFTAIVYVGLLYFSNISATFNGLVNRGKKRLF